MSGKIRRFEFDKYGILQLIYFLNLPCWRCFSRVSNRAVPNHQINSSTARQNLPKGSTRLQAPTLDSNLLHSTPSS